MYALKSSGRNSGATGTIPSSSTIFARSQQRRRVRSLGFVFDEAPVRKEYDFNDGWEISR